MNDEIKLTYLLFRVYLSVLCSLGPFGTIWSDLSSGTWEIEWIPILSLKNHPIQEFPYKILYV